MPATIWKILNKNSPGTSSTFAADDWDMPGRYFNDFDFTATAPTSIKTNTRYWDNRLRIWNPAKTFSYNIRSLALTGNRDVTLPLLTSNDELVMLLHTQTIQNKVMNLANNTFTSTGATTGGIPKHNGTKYVNIARGSAGQVPTVNAGGTDWTWADPTGGAGGLTANSVTTTTIQNLAVTNAKLAGSITGDKILDGALSDAKLAPITDKTKLPADINYGSSEILNTGSINTRHATDHVGMLGGICVTAGTFAAQSVSAGTYQRWTTGAVSGNQAGIRTNVILIERAHAGSGLSCRFAINSTADVKVFVGWVGFTGGFALGSDPLNATYGIGISGDSILSPNWRIIHNDNAGVTVFNDLSTPVAMNTTSHDISILSNDASGRFDVIFDGIQTSISTDIPASTTELALQVYIETSTAAAKELYIRRLSVFGPIS